MLLRNRIFHEKLLNICWKMDLHQTGWIFLPTCYLENKVIFYFCLALLFWLNSWQLAPEHRTLDKFEESWDHCHYTIHTTILRNSSKKIRLISEIFIWYKIYMLGTDKRTQNPYNCKSYNDRRKCKKICLKYSIVFVWKISW